LPSVIEERPAGVLRFSPGVFSVFSLRLRGVLLVLYIFSRLINHKENKKMGLIKFGGGVAGISGKIGGTVYARNKAGAYARNWARPVNPGTVLQSIARGILAAGATQWQTLNASQVDAWNAYAAGMTRLNRQGDSYTPSGRQIFIETYANMRTAGLAPLATPGPTIVSPSYGSFEINDLQATSNLLTKFTVTAAGATIPSGSPPSDCVVVLYSAPSHAAQKTNVNKQRRLVLTEAGDGLATTDIFTEYNAYFGPSSIDGNIIDLWARLIDNLTGLSSPFYKATRVIG
jgi:hypothetical protein